MRFLVFRSAARLAVVLALTLNSSLLTVTAQAPKTYTSSEILLGLKKLNVLGSVLYIAAHPDDENTRLITYLANERLLETGYLSCTRGDGGQNLIGPELGASLGVIRTQELLAARRIDGGRQFFTRANDFGFSKTAEETFTIWDKEQVLADMVWVIRQRRPDVLITRFPPDSRAGHGHHTASALLAIEAFDAAGDPKRFPEQLQYVQTWQPKRLFWNTGSFFVKPGESMDGYLKLDAGGYNPLLGQSYGEIAARSRSQHRSQGFGSAAQRGEALEYLQPLKGDKATKDPFEGVDLSWNRVPGGAAVGKLIEEVIRKYDPSKPSASVAGLLKVREGINNVLTDSREWQGRLKEPRTSATPAARVAIASSVFWLEAKRVQINELIKACLGLYIEASAEQSSITTTDLLKVKWQLLNRSKTPVTLNFARYFATNDSTGEVSPTSDVGKVDSVVKPGESVGQEDSFTLTMKLPVPISQPYWLKNYGNIGMYKIPRQSLVGLAENLPTVRLEFHISFDEQDKNVVAFSVPVQYKHTDPVLGEIYQPLAVVPPVLVNLPAARAYVFADAQPKTLPVTLRAGRAGVSGSLAIQAPKGWDISPATVPFTLKNKDEEQTFSFSLRPGTGAAAGKAELRATATVDGQAYARGIQQIVYPHIPTQTLFPEATAPLVKLNVQRGKTQTVGYLMGAGDEVPEALRQLGYTVTLLDPNTDLTLDRLRRYDAVVLGIRAYNTLDQLKTRQPELLKYVEAGGNLVVQYTVTRGTVIPQIGPYPLTLSNDRVTVENAPITFLAPQHPLLNTPNKITAADFQGWVQEQGLYYPSAWDAKYTPVIASADPGETPKQGAILVADYGKGHYIYTGLSFFRELPAGVPGAYRILANLVSYGK